MKAAAATGVGLSGLTAISGSATAAIGDKLGQVDLPGNLDGDAGFNCTVAGTFDGTHYSTIKDDSDTCSNTILQIYTPPMDGDGTATRESEKDIVDPNGDPVRISALEWDPTRDQYWGAFDGNTYQIDRQDPTDSSQDAIAEFAFDSSAAHDFPPIFPPITDGLALDEENDSLLYSADVSDTVYEFDLPGGAQLGTFQPKNAAGDVASLNSGLALGAQDAGRRTVYVGRNGAAEIIRVYADNGEHISDFATTFERVEGLSCDPVTYETEAILAKDGRNGFYEAFEVEAGTCPLPCDPAVTVDLIADGGSDATEVVIGTVEVSDLNGEISVTYSLEDDWFLRETHLHIAGDEDENGDGDCDRIPQNRKGNPKVGRFGLSRDYGPGVQEDTYVIDQDNNVFGEEFSDGEALCIAAHAAVFQDENDNDTFDPDIDREETAWGEGERFVEKGNWAMHFEYQNPCEENPFN